MRPWLFAALVFLPVAAAATPEKKQEASEVSCRKEEKLADGGDRAVQLTLSVKGQEVKLVGFTKRDSPVDGPSVTCVVRADEAHKLGHQWAYSRKGPLTTLAIHTKLADERVEIERKGESLEVRFHGMIEPVYCDGEGVFFPEAVVLQPGKSACDPEE